MLLRAHLPLRQLILISLIFNEIHKTSAFMTRSGITLRDGFPSSNRGELPIHVGELPEIPTLGVTVHP